MFNLFTKKITKKNYFELPYKEQKRILELSAKGTSKKKQELVTEFKKATTK